MAILIGLDAGHGKYTAGKRCLKKYDPKETREWYLNQRIAKYVEDMLGDYKNVETIRLDDRDGSTDVSLSTRCNTANKKKCDYVVSFHHNAGGGIGLETFIYLTTQPGSKEKAQIIHKAVIKATGQKDRGLKRANFAMVRDTHMAACLIEFGFMDHKIDTPRILKDEFARKAAQGVVNGLVEIFSLKKATSKPSKPSKPNTSKPSSSGLPKGVTEYKGYVEVIYAGKDGIDLHSKPIFEGSVSDVVKKGEVLTVLGRIKVGGTYMYYTKSKQYITSSPKYVSFRKTLHGSTATSKPKKKSVNTVAKEVLEGKWSNGETRRKKLIAYGGKAFADAVQKKVNELL